MRFLIDAQLPPSLARLLRESGRQAEHVRELDLADADDAVIWSHALHTRAVIVTKDDDFVFRSHQSAEAPGIVWLRMGNCSNGILLERLTRLWPAIESALSSGERIVEVN